MPSGLIQIVAYGSQDIYLTSMPEITYFKVVYRKYTNFAIESIDIPFNGNPKFDNRFITTLPKTGDLISKLYIKVEIPAVNLIANVNDVYIDNNIVSTIRTQLSTNQTLLIKYMDFFKFNYIILNGLRLESFTIGSDWYSFKTLITNYKSDLQLKINTIGVILDDVISKYESIFSDSVKSTYYGSDDKTSLLITAIQTFIDNMNIYYRDQEKTLLDTIANMQEGIDNLTSLNEYFAWVEKLGFFLIKKCSLLIGGQEIVSMDSNYLDIHYMLNNRPKMFNLLDEMIGNVSTMTSYSNTPKDSYILYIPIPFWFSQHTGNTIPLISLVYHDVEVSIDFESLDKCCIYNGQSNINNLIQLGECSLLVDYIFLDTDERTKFAQFSHEYLVQSVQVITSSNNNTFELSTELDIFHPVISLYWYIQDQTNLIGNKLYDIYYSAFVFTIVYISQTDENELTTVVPSALLNQLVTIYYDRSNGTDAIFKIGSSIHIKYSKYYDGIYEVIDSASDYVIIKVKYNQYTNYHDQIYGIIYNEQDSSTFNPIKTEYITFNGIDRTPKIDSLYYNGVMPYQTYLNNAAPGLNTYSFSLHPADFQPSGSCNFSLIKSKVLEMILQNKYYNYIIDQNTTYNLIVYAVNYNILRITNGIGTLVFSA